MNIYSEKRKLETKLESGENMKFEIFHFTGVKGVEGGILEVALEGTEPDAPGRPPRRELVAFLVEARCRGGGHHRDRVGQVGAAQETDEGGPKNTQMKILEDFAGENR